MHRHLLRLTPLRFLAALAVVMFHSGRGIPPFDAGWLQHIAAAGNLAVVFFYCLSGFIMATVYGESAVSARTYWCARIARLYPLYLLSGLAMFIIYPLPLSNVVLQVFMLQSWVPGYALNLNPVGWSLSVEAFFYALFPFLIPIISERRIGRFAVFSLILWAATQLFTAYRFAHGYHGFPSKSHDLLFYFPPMHLNEFTLGVTAGVLFTAWNRGRPEIQRLLVGIVVLALGYGLTAAATRAVQMFGPDIIAANGLDAPVFIGVIWLVASLPERIAKPLEWPPFVILGEASYAVYLMQFPVKLGVYHFTARFNGLSPTQNFFLYVAVLTVIAVAIYACIERPLRRLIKSVLRIDDAPSPRREADREVRDSRRDAA